MYYSIMALQCVILNSPFFCWLEFSRRGSIKKGKGANEDKRRKSGGMGGSTGTGETETRSDPGKFSFGGRML